MNFSMSSGVGEWVVVVWRVVVEDIMDDELVGDWNGSGLVSCSSGMP